MLDGDRMAVSLYEINFKRKFCDFVLNIFVPVISVIKNRQLMNGKLSISLKVCSILYVFPRENDYKVDNLFAVVVLLAISNHVK